MGGGQKTLMVSLCTDVQQLSGNEGKLRPCCQPALDGYGGTSIALDGSACHQGVVLQFQLLFRQIGSQMSSHRFGNMKRGADGCRIAPASNRLDLGFLSEQQGQSSQQDGLAGTGFPGDDAKSPRKFDDAVLYECIVMYLKPFKHAVLLPTNSVYHGVLL